MHNTGESDHHEASGGDVHGTDSYIEAIYDKTGIQPALAAYLDGKAEEDDITPLLSDFSMSLAETALSGGSVDTGAVRFGFDHLTDGMNKACNEKHGYEPPKTLREAVQLKMGMVEPQERSYVRKLDDRFWLKQFPEEYENGTLAQRLQGESDQAHLGRSIRAAMHGYIFSYFTMVR